MKAAEPKSASISTIQKKSNTPFFDTEHASEQESPFFAPQEASGTDAFFQPATRPIIQTKLTVGQPNDKYEQEADNVADKVVQRLAKSDNTNHQSSITNHQSAPSVSEASTPIIQHKTEAPEEEKLDRKEDNKEELPELQKSPVSAVGDDEGLQMKCAACEAEEDSGHVQMKGNTERLASSNIESQLNSSKGGGSLLPDETRTSMESAMGADFSNVRVHTGSNAVQMSQDLNAQAFTHGSDVYFNEGKYNPSGTEGGRLLAHELVHTVQQGGTISKKEFIIQRQSTQYQHPEDGQKVEHRLNSQIDREVGDKKPEDGQEQKPIDRRQVAAKQREVSGLAQPDVNRANEAQPEMNATKEEIIQDASNTDVKDPANQEGQINQNKKGSLGNNPSNIADSIFAQAASSNMPSPIAELTMPTPINPVDAGGQTVDLDPALEQRAQLLTLKAQELRLGGFQMQQGAVEEHANAQVLRGNIGLMDSHMQEADAHIVQGQQDVATRREVLTQSKDGLKQSEEKAAMVAAEAPTVSSKADEGKGESEPMVQETESLKAENDGNASDDEDAQEKAREQGGKINQTTEGSQNIDTAFSQTKEKATSLAADAAQAQAKNTESATQIKTTEETLNSTDTKLSQLQTANQAAKSQVQALKSGPGLVTNQANVIDNVGQSLQSLTTNIEQRLQQSQTTYQQDVQAIPAQIQPAAALEGIVEQPDNSVIQSTPQQSETIPSDLLIATNQVGQTSAPSIEGDQAASSQTKTNNAGQEEETKTATQKNEPQESTPLNINNTETASIAQQVGNVAHETQSEGGNITVENIEPSAESSKNAEVNPIPDIQRTVDDSQEDGVVQMAPEQGYEDREQIDLLPAFTEQQELNEAQREEQRVQAQQKRQQDLAFIESQAQGGYQNLSVGGRMMTALRLTGRNLFGGLSNIHMPSARQLALALINPVESLKGVVSGLNMTFGGIRNLFSAEQWRQDPLGNLLKSAADIATGLTVILGSITLLAGVIAAIMTAITIFSFGLAAPVTGPIIAFCATVMTTVGGWTIVVGKFALILQALVFVKNLIQAATANTAEELLGASNRMTSDARNFGNAALQVGLGKLSQLGGRGMSTAIRDAGGGVRYAGQLGATLRPTNLANMGRSVVRGVRNLTAGGVRASVGRVGQGIKNFVGNTIRSLRTPVPRGVPQLNRGFLIGENVGSGWVGLRNAAQEGRTAAILAQNAESAAAQSARGISEQKPRMHSEVIGQDGSRFNMNFRTDLSGTAQGLVRRLEKYGFVRVNSIHPDDLAAISRFLGREIGVLQTPYKSQLRLVLGTETGILKSQVRAGEVFVVHTHPVSISNKSHFRFDIPNAGRHTEGVIDWNGQITYFNNRGIQNPITGTGNIQPMPSNFRAAFIDAEGNIIGYSRIEIIENANGTTRVQVIE